jgi:hypothetical protein
MKKIRALIILLITVFIIFSAVAQEPVTKPELPPDKDMQILELQITVLSERIEKLQAQSVLVSNEREKLINRYKAKKAEAEKVKADEKLKDKKKEGQ